MQNNRQIKNQEIVNQKYFARKCDSHTELKFTGLILNEIANIFGKQFPRFHSETSKIAGFLLAITLCTNAFLENKVMKHICYGLHKRITEEQVHLNWSSIQELDQGVSLITFVPHGNSHQFYYLITVFPFRGSFVQLSFVPRFHSHQFIFCSPRPNAPIHLTINNRGSPWKSQILISYTLRSKASMVNTVSHG